MQRLTFHPDRLIRDCASWQDFWTASASLSEKQKGDVFERLLQLYLQTKPKYKTALSAVWLARTQVPADVRKRLNLPLSDEGIDLIAQTTEGNFWAIQAKFKSDPTKAPTYKELSTFSNLAFVHCKGIALALVAHTSTRPVRKRLLLGSLTEIGLAEWLNTTDEDWALLRDYLGGKPSRPVPKKPRQHQEKAIEQALKHYIEREGSRGRLIMPCGTGKSLTAFWIAQALKSRSIAVFVPSLALIKQTVEDWTREIVALDETPLPEWLCVCSDETSAALDEDEFVAEVYDLGFWPTTKLTEIAEFLRRNTAGRRMVFVTYHSSEALADAARKAGFTFDLAILDEAHKTAGVKDKAFALPLFDENLPAAKRLFMTATERVVRGRNEDVVSMKDEAVYGPCFHELSFKDAIHADPPIISDYKILTYIVTDEEVSRFIRENRLLTDIDAKVEEEEARAVAAGIALRQAFKRHGIKHAISFHRSITLASRFANQQQAFTDHCLFSPPVEAFHISSKKSAGVRKQLLTDFEASTCALMTNARCLTEGVDVPAIDCVLFADSKQSKIDIVQAAGRALRRYDGKSYGYIMLPIIVPSGMSFEEFADKTEFRHVARVITALSTQDERIAEEFRLKLCGRVPTGKIVEIEGSVPIGAKINIQEFSKAIETKLWEHVGRANWRPYDEALKFVHPLKLKGAEEWVAYSQGERKDLPPKPPDIPAYPNQFYGEEFLQKGGYGGWLGTGTIATNRRTYRPYDEAVKFVHPLKLKNHDPEWLAYCRGERKDLPPKPDDIPFNAARTYGEEFRRKGGWGGWLGTKTIATQQRKYRPYDEAIKFVHPLKLQNHLEWVAYCADERKDLPSKPDDIPSNPNVVYHEFQERRGWGGWLGTGTIANKKRTFKSYDDAVTFAHTLKLQNQREWNAYLRGERKDLPRRPQDIPSNPYSHYGEEFREKGGWRAWLGDARGNVD